MAVKRFDGLYNNLLLNNETFCPKNMTEFTKKNAEICYLIMRLFVRKLPIFNRHNYIIFTSKVIVIL